MTQREFEAMEQGQQLYAIVIALDPSFTMTQRAFEAMEPAQQLFQLFDVAGSIAGGTGTWDGSDVAGTNFKVVNGIFYEKNASTGLWQTIVPTGAVNAETIEFGAQA